ncbi:MAG: CheY-like chemotaxis protein [Cryomorphaceae bacterium]|jgi:CheY-like chemotaxis protein
MTKTAWIVDDDPVSRLLIKKTLERTELFSSYREFIDGSDFICELSEIGNLGFDEPDLILLDVNMPQKNGWEVLDFIQKKNISFNKSHVFLLSSSINPKDKARAFSYDSIKGYLQKPLAKDDIESLNL